MSTLEVNPLSMAGCLIKMCKTNNLRNGLRGYEYRILVVREQHNLRLADNRVQRGIFEPEREDIGKG
jgi:hypothetical protein